MRVALLITLLLLTASCWAAEPNCPATLVVEETLKQSPEGWTQGRADVPRRLSGITIFEGDPKDLASLIGEQRKPSRNTMISTWQFTPGAQYWISCTYSGTRIVLSRPIPSNYRAVVITYDMNVSIDGTPEIQKTEWRTTEQANRAPSKPK
jgi:hypothetical protein